MRVRTTVIGLAALGALATGTVALQSPAVADTASANARAGASGPLVVAHRGASGYRPEHTLAAYQLAIDLGADVIEPDVVSTKDRVLVARHENEIGGTTNVATLPQFASRQRTKSIDGVTLTGWFTEDFTLRELKTLRAKERIPAVRQENTIYDGRYEVPTLDEVLQLVRTQSKATGRTITVIPETKHPTYFDGIGKSLEEPLLRSLEKYGYTKERDAAIIQSFEVRNLQELNRSTDLRLVQLYGATGRPFDFTVKGDPRTYRDLATAAGLRGVSRYADVVGPDKNLVIPVQADGTLGAPTAFVADAHRVGLLVTPYTFRAENQFLPPALRSSADPAAYGNVFAELQAFYAAGVDGVFADQPDIAKAARDDDA